MHTGTYGVSSGIGLLGIVHATLLDEFMNVVQKERNKYQVRQNRIAIDIQK